MAQNPSILPAIVLIAVVVIAGGAAGAYLYFHNAPKQPSAPLTVAVGDNVTVNYIGYFGSGPEQGKVFDTSLHSVATDNSTYPKAIQFHMRASAANYTPLPVHVGSGTPSNGYSFANQSIIQVVTGFWQGLVGLPGNQSRAVTVPPADGYGSTNPACVRSLPITIHAPVFETVSGPAFSKMFPGVLATTGSSFVNSTYGWKTHILSANQTSVSLENIAYVGETSSLQGWPVLVTNVTGTANGTGQITAVTELTAADAGHLAGKTSTGLCQSQSNGVFIVTAVNFTSGTFTEDFNQEVVGQTLVFVVTVVDIYVPPATIV